MAFVLILCFFWTVESSLHSGWESKGGKLVDAGPQDWKI